MPAVLRTNSSQSLSLCFPDCEGMYWDWGVTSKNHGAQGSALFDTCQGQIFLEGKPRLTVTQLGAGPERWRARSGPPGYLMPLFPLHSSCWLSLEGGLLYAFVGPAAVIVLVRPPSASGEGCGHRGSILSLNPISTWGSPRQEGTW